MLNPNPPNSSPGSSGQETVCIKTPVFDILEQWLWNFRLTGNTFPVSGVCLDPLNVAVKLRPFPLAGNLQASFREACLKFLIFLIESPSIQITRLISRFGLQIVTLQILSTQAYLHSSYLPIAMAY